MGMLSPSVFTFQRDGFQDFPGGPVAKTWCFQCRGAGSIPDLGAKSPHAVWCSPLVPQTN